MCFKEVCVFDPVTGKYQNKKLRAVTVILGFFPVCLFAPFLKLRVCLSFQWKNILLQLQVI